MNPLLPMIGIAAGATLFSRRGRRAERDPNVTAGALQFYRGGKGRLPGGAAYFISLRDMAAFYGPVQEHRLYLRNPKFVSEDEWMDFDSIALAFDSSPVERLRAEGHDGAVSIRWSAPRSRAPGPTRMGRPPVYVVYALSGTEATTKKPKRGASIHDALLAAEGDITDNRLKSLRRIAKRLNLDVRGLTTSQGDGYTEVWGPKGRVWISEMGRPRSAIEAKADYITELIEQKLYGPGGSRHRP